MEIFKKATEDKDYVYFAKREDGLVKIGKSSQVNARIKTIEKECKQKIIEIFYIYGYSDTERETHEAFKDYRVTGEWFDIDMTEIMEKVKTMNFIELRPFNRKTKTEKQKIVKERNKSERDEVIFLRVSKDMKEQLQEQADKADMTVNAFVIMLVMKYLRGERE